MFQVESCAIFSRTVFCRGVGGSVKVGGWAKLFCGDLGQLK